MSFSLLVTTNPENIPDVPLPTIDLSGLTRPSWCTL